MGPNQNADKPYITIIPERALLDEAVQISLAGFPARSTVIIFASTEDDEGNGWSSQATFLTGEDGTVNVGAQCPVAGSYDIADAMGLLWSMARRGRKGKLAPTFVKTQLAIPTTITLSAHVNDALLAQAQMLRLHQADGVTEHRVRESGLIGKLFVPADAGPHAGLLVLSGSDGTIRERAAALLASHGYAALALVYFGVEDLPKRLARVPLEYCEQGISWLQQRPEVVSEQIGVIGASRGGELALLLGATFPQIKAVVATAPSGLIHGGVGTAPSVPAWTYHGEALPHSAYQPRLSELAHMVSTMIRRVPFVGVPLYLKELDDKQTIERASIPVEKIQGPILLISGKEDEMWPSPIYAEMIMERLARYNFPFAYQHLQYDGAGHILGIPYSFPYLPPPIAPQATGPALLAFGGRLRESAQADSASWQQMLAFLKKSFTVPD